MYTAKTKNLAVIGYPISHSLSPVMQNAAIEKANIDYFYIAMSVEEKNLKNAVEGLKATGFIGFNVTIPHKTNIIPYLDEIDKDSEIIGAVNTVLNEKGKLKGYNTDVIGFLTGLKNNNFSIAGKKAVVLGAGGAARAVIWGLIKEGCSQITIGVRNPQKANKLVTYFSSYVNITALSWEDDTFVKSLNSTALLVNTTPIGMSPNLDAMPPINFEKLNSEAVVYDIIYTPQKTKFLIEAESHRHKIINGEMMLVGQGMAALTLWTKITPNYEVMLYALRKALINNNTSSHHNSL